MRRGERHGSFEPPHTIANRPMRRVGVGVEVHRFGWFSTEDSECAREKLPAPRPPFPDISAKSPPQKRSKRKGGKQKNGLDEKAKPKQTKHSDKAW